jgi:hypothetical protein
MRLLSVLVVAASLSFASLAAASPAANVCDRTAEERAGATTIVLAKATGVSTVEKNGTRFVRVSYTVDRALKGKAAKVVVVEDTCRLGAPKLEELGYPGVASYCGSFHAMPGLDDRGRPNGNVVSLPLVDTKSALDGRGVRRLVRISPWSPCRATSPTMSP